MVMAGESVTGGKTTVNRITWHNDEANGTVRQHWEVSSDNGDTWQTVFDGLYQKTQGR